MSKISIITDSLVDMPKELLEKNVDLVIPLTVMLPDLEKEFLDGVTITADEIYEHVNKGGALPKTSAITPQIFADAFKNELDKGNQVFYIGTGSGISCTYQNAVLAANEVDPTNKNIMTVDSMTLSTGIGILILKARRLINEGKTLKEVTDIINSDVPKLSVKFTVDSLLYLYKGGRCSGLIYTFGNMLKIHPIIRVNNNKLAQAEKPRGKYQKAMDLQINEFKEDLPNIDLNAVFVTHSGPDDFEFAQYCYDAIKDLVPEGNLHIARAGSTVSSHCGPKTLGILYLLKEKKG